MVLLTLPQELVEEIIANLASDKKSLASCSETCRILLGLCRSRLWSRVTIALPSADVSYVPPRVRSLLQILEDRPSIARAIHSISIRRTSKAVLVPSQEGHLPLVERVCSKLPSLRSLELRQLFAGCLFSPVLLAHTFPTLESLCIAGLHVNRLDNGAFPSSGWAELERSVRQERVPSRRWALKALSITNSRIPHAELDAAMSFFDRLSPDYIAIRSLDLRSNHWPDIPPFGPSHRPVIPSYRASLRHLGIAVKDMDIDGTVHVDGRDHIERLYASLPHCHELRSLSIQYDGNNVRASAHVTGWGPPPIFPFFLEALADTLSGTAEHSPSRPSPAPLPKLEQLSLTFVARVDRILNCADAFGRLASVLVADDGGQAGEPQPTTSSRRYPAFSLLAVHALPAVVRPVVDEPGVVYDAERASYEQGTDGRLLLWPLLERFESAGVRVAIEVN
ncbi:hypothetical protein C8Q77DRAFT_1068426 [Trametes polyzona]|nr:hypothetical protein C8Q77DRAFT_1068426 [Trametes polyzona]